jgi:hypothetical protein
VFGIIARRIDTPDGMLVAPWSLTGGGGG